MKDKPLKIGVIGGIEKRIIQIVDYDERWITKFEEHSNNIQAILGDVVVNIEHIGSTAVPDLAAKPIIDILLIVKDASDESKYLTKMEAAGYQLRVREPDFHEHRMFRTIKKDVHIHIFSEGSTEIDRYLVFRNRLRQNENDRKAYEAIKRKLATNEWNKMDDYAQAKTEIIERIISSGLKG